MFRTICTVACLMLATAVRAEPMSLHESYDVVGTNPDGSKYSGTVKVHVISEASFTIKWMIGDAVYDGFGMRNDDALAATYTINGRPGLVIYKVGDGGVWRGIWVVKGGDEGGTERLKPHGD